MKNHQNKWMPFEEARAFVRTLNLKNDSDWLGYVDSGNLPDNIPKTPKLVFRDKGWIGLGDWLGTGVIQSQRREYLSFEDARTYARLLQLNQIQDWEKHCKSGLKPANIPASPRSVYGQQGWAGMSDWLGIKPFTKGKIDYLPFEQAREFVHKQRIKKIPAWRDWCKSEKKPENIPGFPDTTYKNKGWIGWRDWLGPL